MKQTRLLSILLWILVGALLSISLTAWGEDRIVGRTGWDLAISLYNSMPTVVFAIGITAWLVTKLLMRVIEFLQPERVRMRDMWTRLDTLDNELRDSERRSGYLLIMVRELEHALELCAKDCPSCKNAVDNALKVAKEKATVRGFIRADDATLPRGAEV